ncbi:MAG: DNA polymerase IV [Saprospiraceae bacterium]|nr:MAG: DNA-directed DNA polymerase [Bacteroidetes bacterium OLB9]MCO6463776.1 DNA polymerase IV [Saprospiraceae bacterium]
MYDRAVLHLDLDSFFVSVECLKNSSLLGKPLLIGGTSQRGVVASCSYEARRFGVHSAMPMKMALRLCPQAIVLRGDMDSYTQHSAIVTEIIAETAPTYEKASIDEFYLDLTGMDRHFGCYQWSSELRQKIIRESGLPISFGLSINKTVSKIGTGEAKPNGTKYIPNGTEKNFLAPLPVKKIPGIGEQTYKKLSFMGVRFISTLSAVPIRLLEREFGKPGRTLWERANGIDPTPIVPYHEQKSISKEHTFTEDTLDVRMMKDLLLGMADKLSFELRTAGKLTSTVTVKIRYADFNTYTRQKSISYTANDRILGQHILEIFDKLYERRQLIRLIGVKYSGLVQGNTQINLFDDTVEHIRLMQQMDRIRKRFGADAIMRASSIF